MNPVILQSFHWYSEGNGVLYNQLKEKASYLKELGIKVHTGIYLGLQGPTFETPAEYGMVRILGGDAVGMSTVPEVIVARHMGMNVFGISIITDVGGPDIAFSVSHDEVLAAADTAMPNVIKIVRKLIKDHAI